MISLLLLIEGRVEFAIILLSFNFFIYTFINFSVLFLIIFYSIDKILIKFLFNLFTCFLAKTNLLEDLLNKDQMSPN